MTRLLIFLLALATVLAGCAGLGGDDGDDAGERSPGGTDTAPAGAGISGDEARTLLERALANTPDRYGFDLVATKRGSELMRVQGTYDNITGEAHLHVKGDAAAFAPLRLPEDGLALYTSEGGAVYRVGGVSVVQAAAVEELEGVVPSQLMTPQSFLTAQDGNLTITSIEATTWKDEPAARVGFTIQQDDMPVSGSATLLQNPARLVRIEATLPDTRDSGPLAGATLGADLHHGEDAAPMPEDAARLVGFAHTLRAQSSGNQTWTFLHDSGIALADVVVRAQDASEGGAPAEKRVVFEMRLAEGEATQQGVTLAFDDANGDGLVSKGDTLRVTVGDDAAFRPQVLLYDEPTRSHVTGDLFLVMRSLFGGF